MYLFICFDPGNDEISATLTSEENVEEIPLQIIDNNNGSYTIHYNVFSRTNHRLSVYIRKKPIPGSPFHINVSTGIDVGRIGGLLTKFGAAGVSGVGGGGGKQMENYEPWGVTYDKNDRLIVTDHNNHKIQV